MAYAKEKDGDEEEKGRTGKRRRELGMELYEV